MTDRAFDPSQPYEVVGAGNDNAPPFDPSKPFEAVPDKPSNDPLPGPVMDKARQFAASSIDFSVAKYGTRISRIAEAFGQSFDQAWGPERLGLSDESIQKGREAGLFRNLEDDKLNPFKAFNETIFSAGAYMLDASARGFQGAWAGAQAAGTAAGLHRDIVSIPDAFMGSPHLGIPKLAEPKPFVKPVDIKPIEGSPDPLQPRTVAAKTGDGLINAILDHPTMKAVIENPVLDDSHTVPNSLGTSMPLENPTLYRDRDFPKQMTVDGVTFDTAEPSAVHENVEAFAIEAMVKGGMDQATALKVGFWEFGEKAEDAWYSAHGMDPEKVEAKYTEHLNRIASRGTEGADRADAVRKEINLLFNDQIGRDELSPGATALYKKMPSEIKEAGFQIYENSGKFDRFLTENDILDDDVLGGIRAQREIKNKEASFKFHSWLSVQLPSVPDDLFRGTYPDSDPAKAGPGPIDKPAPEEVQRGRELVASHLQNDKPYIDLGEARQLGVIGPERPSITEGTPADAANGAIPPPDQPPRGPGKPPNDGGAAASDNPWRQRFDHFVSRLAKPDDIKELIKNAADDQNDFPAARSGDVPLAHVEAIADAAGVAPESVDARGLGRLFKTDAEVRIAMQVMMQTTENVKTAAREHKANPSDASRIALQEAMLRRDMAVEQVVGYRGEWGRVGNALQEFMSEIKDQEGLSKFLEGKGRTPKDLDAVADAIDQMDRGQAAKFLNDARRPSFMDKLFWYWQNSLISGWLTHTKYGEANATYLGWERGVVTPIAAMIGKAKQLAGVTSDRVFLGESLAGVAGTIAATPMSFLTAIKSVKTGLRVPLPGEAVAGAVNPITMSQRPIGGVAGRVIGAPGDAANAIHTFFRLIGYEGEMQAQAYRQAAKEGLSPLRPEFWDRQTDIRANGTEDMMASAIDVANRGTFVQESGPKAKAFQRFVKEVPGLRWLFPFTHIPLNLMKAAVEITPVAPLSGEVRAALKGEKGGVAQDKAIARMVAGSALMGWFVNETLNGRATGDYPNDPKERDLWKLQGKQPNSILMGDHWVSYNKFGPVGDAIGIAANLGQAIPHLKSEDGDEVNKATWFLADAAGNLVTDEVGMQSLKNLFEAMKDDNKGSRFVSTTVGSFMPYSSFAAQTASFIDPSMRQAKGIIDGLKYRIPGMRETLLPVRDWSGQPVANPQYGNILRQRQVNTDPVDNELAVLGIHPAPPQDRVGGVKLPAKLYDNYQTVAGAFTRTTLEGLVKTDNWHNLPPVVREDMIRRTIAQTRQMAGAAMQAAHPEIIKQGVEDQTARITGAKKGKLQDSP